MNEVLLKGARIFDGKHFIKENCIVIGNEKILSVNENIPSFKGKIVDFSDYIVSPGFIDLHIHGIFGFDTMDATIESLYGMAKKVIEYGVTSFTPTTLTSLNKNIKASLRSIKEFISQRRDDCAQVLGAHLEGPFINPIKKAAKNMVGEYGDIVRTMTIAPELAGTSELIEFLQDKKVNISIGHSCAVFEDVEKAVSMGVNRATHLFNAMGRLHHRDPGTVGGTLFFDNIYCEVIADLVHIHHAILKMIVKQKSSDKCILITDSMKATALKDGVYNLGDLKVIVAKGVPRLIDGTLAGSTLTFDKAVKNMVEKVGIPLEDVLKMATSNPASLLGIDKVKGRVKEGYDADIILLNKNLDVCGVFVKGKMIFNYTHLSI
jgi:N-acetylglucosamine-6-phosphate deacetylase